MEELVKYHVQSNLLASCLHVCWSFGVRACHLFVDRVVVKSCLLYTSDAADDWLVV